ncbi:alpha/beta hydrolase [Chthonobacter rhizosphaerae]|uniref:alpha/beta hydrolase n=1 Tax=Chthonobacter rhizosphaerae TaxID=2735553 RepID=UPI0015EF4269|nr:dienelactone hydrolase family protein [Chthonobacter rhizosphaerae]
MTDTTTPDRGPHAGIRIYARGPRPDDAAAAVILLHGRGANAPDILSLADPLGGEAVAYVAPEANGQVWYPQRFLAPTRANEPFLSSAIGVVDDLARGLHEAGIPYERMAIAGFSQGACLALEFAARNPRRYGAVIGFSGGLIGTDEEIEGRTGNLDGTPVFLGCSDVDFHIPVERVHASARILSEIGGAVTERIYPGMDHTINDDEIGFAAGLIAAMERAVATR